MTNDRGFPAGFLWGAATAAYQIEGSVTADGRGPSIWDTFSHTPGRTLNGDNGDVACQHYERLAEDLELVQQLGLRAYRFSVAWPRIQPDGKGPANQAGLDFYRRLVAGLRERGVEPVCTLYHWDLPQSLEDLGGWTSRETSERFAEYASMVGDALSDGVARWVTLNEPWCSAWLGYGTGVHAPGHAEGEMAVLATHHLLLAHARATEVLRQVTKAPVGITLNLGGKIAASDHELDLAAARRADGHLNRAYLDPLFKGEYPADMAELYPSRGPGREAVHPGDLAAISQPIDFLGVNYYSTSVLADPSRLQDAREAGYLVYPGGLGRHPHPDRVDVGRASAERTAAGWEVDADGLRDILVRVHDEYTSIPLYITENGAAEHDYVGPDGVIHDQARVRYLEQHIQAAKDAIDQGVDLRGYFVWSLMDNFEWALGYSMRFGIVWVDYPSGKRTPKDSYHWYKRLVRENALPHGT